MIHLFVTNPPADPFEYGAKVTGNNALRLLILTLAFTPFRLITGIRQLGPYRRTLGVLTFTYAFAHLFGYMFLEAEFDLAFVFEDIQDRRYITVGFLAFIMLVPLAITSNNYMVSKTGTAWRKIHRMVYPISILACVHFLWVKRGDDIIEPLIYLSVVILLLAVRVVDRARKKRKKALALAR